MENSAANTDPSSSLATGSGGATRRYGLSFSASNLIQAPLCALLEYSGILRSESSHLESERMMDEGFVSVERDHVDESVSSAGDGEVSIRIIGIGDQDNSRRGMGIALPVDVGVRRAGVSRNNGDSMDEIAGSSDRQGEAGSCDIGGFDLSSSVRGATMSASPSGVFLQDGNREGNAAGVNGRDSAYQRYGIQQAARWIEPVLPFSLLLLIVFIRQHLQGFFVTVWLTFVMFKSNDVLRKQTALKGERKISILVGITLILILHLFGVYWLYRNGDLFHPLVMLPPKDTPSFWQAIFTILLNDTIVRQVAMVFKCILLMYYKNKRGRNYRKQGQLLTLVEHLALLYRTILPTPVWYRFFLNKEYGSLFSSLTTGLYLTFKLTSVVGKVHSFLSAVKALSGKKVHYGSQASAEQVIAAGDLCSICQERMHAPILLGCKHIFCEDCASEWFEKERTCPICRAFVKPADLRSFSDGSTSLLCQIF